MSAIDIATGIADKLAELGVPPPRRVYFCWGHEGRAASLDVDHDGRAFAATSDQDRGDLWEVQLDDLEPTARRILAVIGCEP